MTVAVAANVCTNHAVVFAAIKRPIPRGKNNGTTTIMLINKGSVVVCAVKRSAPHIFAAVAASLFML
jgi:hypothetical protein